MNETSILLSPEASLVYILQRSGCRGRLCSGRVQWFEDGHIHVYDERGVPLDYISGEALRTWCVIDSFDAPINGWHHITPEDDDFLLAYHGKIDLGRMAGKYRVVHLTTGLDESDREIIAIPAGAIIHILGQRSDSYERLRLVWRGKLIDAHRTEIEQNTRGVLNRVK